MKKILTQAGLDALKPKEARYEVADAQIGGLRITIHPSGASWILRYRLHGKQAKHTIGAYPSIPLKEARRRAAKAKALIADGTDPSGEKKAARAATEAPADLFESVAQAFVARQ